VCREIVHNGFVADSLKANGVVFIERVASPPSMQSARP